MVGVRSFVYSSHSRQHHTPKQNNSPSVRERTQEALGLVAAKVGGGPMAVLEGLGPAIRSSSTSGRNPRVRQEAARCLARLAAGVVAAGAWRFACFCCR